MQGIRGAITVEENTKEEILQAAQELIAEMCRLNAISPEDIGAVIFSATDDITAAFPAAGARRLPGFDCVPLFDTRQMDVDGSLQKCIRALLFVNTDKGQSEIRHAYLRRASLLRPDLTK